MNYSLLRYAGGKTKAVALLSKFILSDTKEICSPFFGGGSFEIALAQQGITMHGYDSFFPLVCFWKSVLNHREELHALVKNYFPLSKEKFYALQKEVIERERERDELQIGAMFYVLNRCSFSGTGLSGGMSPNHPRFTMRQIDSILRFDTSFKMDCLPFEQSIPKHNCLLYADPPYFTSQKLYGNKGSLHTGFDHALLALILNARRNFILSYNNCNAVKELYASHRFFYPEWKYGMSKDKNSKEILIVSNDLKIEL